MAPPDDQVRQAGQPPARHRGGGSFAACGEARAGGGPRFTRSRPRTGDGTASRSSSGPADTSPGAAMQPAIAPHRAAHPPRTHERPRQAQVPDPATRRQQRRGGRLSRTALPRPHAAASASPARQPTPLGERLGRASISGTSAPTVRPEDSRRSISAPRRSTQLWTVRGRSAATARALFASAAGAAPRPSPTTSTTTGRRAPLPSQRREPPTARRETWSAAGAASASAIGVDRDRAHHGPLGPQPRRLAGPPPAPPSATACVVGSASSAAASAAVSSTRPLACRVRVGHDAAPANNARGHTTPDERHHQLPIPVWPDPAHGPAYQPRSNPSCRGIAECCGRAPTAGWGQRPARPAGALPQHASTGVTRCCRSRSASQARCHPQLRGHRRQLRSISTTTACSSASLSAGSGRERASLPGIAPRRVEPAMATVRNARPSPHQPLRVAPESGRRVRTGTRRSAPAASAARAWLHHGAASSSPRGAPAHTLSTAHADRTGHQPDQALPARLADGPDPPARPTPYAVSRDLLPPATGRRWRRPLRPAARPGERGANARHDRATAAPGTRSETRPGPGPARCALKPNPPSNTVRPPWSVGRQIGLMPPRRLARKRPAPAAPSTMPVHAHDGQVIGRPQPGGYLQPPRERRRTRLL
jgi:hypothetical protein